MYYCMIIDNTYCVWPNSFHYLLLGYITASSPGPIGVGALGHKREASSESKGGVEDMFVAS